jgi:hypothetical protein
MVVKAFPNIPAIKVLQGNLLHDPNGINIEQCTGIITSASSMQDISNTYVSVMPDWLTQSFFNPELERQRLNAHQYCENDNVRMMRKMDSLHLIDFVELRLKSKNDFDAAYDIILGTGLSNYMKKCVVIQPGDWPCQFYCRQIVYSSLKIFLAFNPELRNNTQQSPSTDHADHSYSFQQISHQQSYSNESLHYCMTPQPSILSIVPAIGPLHISLNSREHIISTFHPFF